MSVVSRPSMMMIIVMVMMMIYCAQPLTAAGVSGHDSVSMQLPTWPRQSFAELLTDMVGVNLEAGSRPSRERLFYRSPSHAQPFTFPRSLGNTPSGLRGEPDPPRIWASTGLVPCGQLRSSDGSARGGLESVVGNLGSSECT